MSLPSVHEYKSDVKPIWCPGCGDFGVLGAFYKVLAGLNLKPAISRDVQLELRLNDNAVPIAAVSSTSSEKPPAPTWGTPGPRVVSTSPSDLNQPPARGSPMNQRYTFAVDGLVTRD